MKEIQQFWKWFSDNQEKIKQATDPIPEELLSEILKHLHEIDDGLFFEIGHDPMSTEVEFVVTPEGDNTKYDLTKEVVASAPSLSDWVFIAFRPAMGFDFKTEYEGLELDPQKIWFLPLSAKEDPNEIGISVGIKGYQKDEEEKYLNACYLMLDTCIGEEKAMNDIHYLSVCELPEDPEKDGFIEFSELSAYIDWKREQ